MNDLAAELRYRREQRLVAQEMAMDHAYVVQRIGTYEVLEGAGTDAGSWFSKGRGENKRFKTRAQAVEHATHSNDPSTATDAQPVASTAASSGTPNMGRVISKDSDKTDAMEERQRARALEAMQKQEDSRQRKIDDQAHENRSFYRLGRGY